MAGDWTEEITHVAGTDLAIIKGGQGKPLLVLHEEMGHPGWLNWHAALSKERTLLIPIQPPGITPPEVEIFDLFVVTQRTPLNLSVHDPENTPEFAKLYGGERTPEQFEAFEDSRTETARIAWEPILHSQGLPHFLQGVSGLPTQIVWGRDDALVPVSAAQAYKQALKNTETRLTIFDDCGH